MSDEITTREEYLKQFGDDEGVPPASKRQHEALKYAHEIRKFEVALYWQRAAYFWTFIAAAFGGFFLLEKRDAPPGEGDSRFLVACVGFVFSVAWSLANRGSKYCRTTGSNTSIYSRRRSPGRFTR